MCFADYGAWRMFDCYLLVMVYNFVFFFRLLDLGWFYWCLWFWVVYLCLLKVCFVVVGIWLVLICDLRASCWFLLFFCFLLSCCVWWWNLVLFSCLFSLWISFVSYGYIIVAWLQVVFDYLFCFVGGFVRRIDICFVYLVCAVDVWFVWLMILV